MLPSPLLATLEREQPASILLIQHTQDANSDEIPAGMVQTTPIRVLGDEFTERVDLVFIREECLHQRKEPLMQLVAKCRDLISSRVLIEMGPESMLEEADMLALAFIRYAVTETPDCAKYRYFYFDLKTYKPVPDWLNPKFWANPQNWDKYRW